MQQCRNETACLNYRFAEYAVEKQPLSTNLSPRPSLPSK